MNKRNHQDMSNINQALAHRRNKQKKSSRIEAVPIPLIDIESLISIAKLSIANPHITYKNINMTVLLDILPQLEELENIIGMKELKGTIFYQIIYYLQQLHLKSDDYLHTVILGNPGCGKTTVARIIGKLYSNLGVLKNKTFTTVRRADMIGEYLGQTSVKVNKLLKASIGGVLFIDEVYSLGAGSKDKKDSYSKEAIDALNMFLSEHKNDFCCIVAGYEKEVNDCFFSINQGLKRRFPWVHKISKYDAKQLSAICFKKIKDIEWQTTVSEKEMEKMINKNEQHFKNAGGDVENMITMSKMSHAKRVFSLDDHHKFILTSSDLQNALELIHESNKPEVDETDKIHFDMYS